MGINMPNFEELTTPQRNILEVVLKQKENIIVVGGPGTGKSILAIHAYNMNKRDENTELVAFNKILVQYFEEGYGGLDDNKEKRVSFKTFDGLFWYKKVKITKQPPNKDELDDNYNETTEKEMSKYINDNRFENIFDTLIIDEAQDLSLIRHRLALEMGNRKIIFLDDLQKVNENGTDKRTIKNLLYKDVKEYSLVQNFRNTNEIYELTKFLFDSMDNQLTIRSGDKPELIKFNDENRMLNYIVNIIDNNPTKSIGIFYPYQSGLENIKKDFYYLEKQIRKELPDLDDRFSLSFGSDNNSINFSNNHIHLITTNIHKGLEYDIVIMPYLNSEFYHNRNYEQNLGKAYVGVTRASEQLYMMYSGDDNNSFMINKLKEGSYLLDIKEVD